MNSIPRCGKGCQRQQETHEHRKQANVVNNKKRCSIYSR
jgi:hypothetical protein